MSDAEFICKHCGSDVIYARVEAIGTSDGDIATNAQGKPYFLPDGRPNFDDVYETSYVCEGCGKNAASLERLVIRRQAGEQLKKPCGRCDHDALDHAAMRDGARPGDVRPPMPCEVAGCDCYDYYDREVALAGLAAPLMEDGGR